MLKASYRLAAKRFLHSPEAVRSMASSTAVHVSTFAGLDVVSPLIGLSEEQGAFYNLGKSTYIIKLLFIEVQLKYPRVVAPHAAKAFARTDMKPHASKWDEESHFPMDVMKKLAGKSIASLLDVSISISINIITALFCHILIAQT